MAGARAAAPPMELGEPEFHTKQRGLWSQAFARLSRNRLALFSADGRRRQDVLDQSVNVSGLVWTDEGDLLVTTQASVDGSPGTVELLRVDPDRGGSDFVLGAERVDGAWVTSARPGYAMLHFWATDRTMIAILRTSDYATGAVTLTQRMMSSEVLAIDLVDR